jgi:hypothetical protein
MTSIDSAQIGDAFIGTDIGGTDIGRAAHPGRGKKLARKVAVGFGMSLVTCMFLVATAATIPVIAVYSFVWLAQL